jgi:hypothetical protein
MIPKGQTHDAKNSFETANRVPASCLESPPCEYDKTQSSRSSLTAQLAFREDQGKKHGFQDRGGLANKQWLTTPLKPPTGLPLLAMSRPHASTTRYHHQHHLSLPNRRSGRSWEKTRNEERVEDCDETRHLANTPGTRSNLAAPVRIPFGASLKASRSPDIPPDELPLACPPPANPASSFRVCNLLCPRNPLVSEHVKTPIEEGRRGIWHIQPRRWWLLREESTRIGTAGTS